MSVRDGGLHEGLGLLRVLPLCEGVAPDRQPDDSVDQRLGDGVQVDKQAPRICVHIESLVEVSTMVHFADDLSDNQRDPVYLSLLTHEVNLVMQGLCHLEYRVDEEPIAQRLGFGTEGVEQFLA